MAELEQDQAGHQEIAELKDDYPMVAPAYAATRSALAKKIDLGRKPEPVAKFVKAPRKRAVRKLAAKRADSEHLAIFA